MQSPLVKPVIHVQRYVWYGMEESSSESEHAAPFWHGDDAHSSTSLSQLPPVATLHNSSYSVM
jgi:hypothetical protein